MSIWISNYKLDRCTPKQTLKADSFCCNASSVSILSGAGFSPKRSRWTGPKSNTVLGGH